MVFLTGKRLPVWADGPTQRALLASFGYAFVQPPDSPNRRSGLNTIDGPVEVTGAGGVVRLEPFRADHGSIDALGFRIGPLAYLPDAVAIPAESWPHLAGLDCWVVDALRRRPHPTHAHLEMTLGWIAQARPRARRADQHARRPGPCRAFGRTAPPHPPRP